MSGQPLLGGLRGRVAVLAALIALLATIACATLAAQALVGGLRTQRQSAALAVAEQARNRINRLVQRLAFENADYAVWDELHARMPRPPEEWSQVNMRPGRDPGRLTQAFALVADGVVMARYRRSTSRSPDPTRDDPAPPAALVALVLAEPQAGVATPGGFPVLFASHPVQPSDGTGPSKGALVALCYLTSSLHPDLLQSGYELELAPISRPADGYVAWREGRAAATVSVPTHDGRALAITVVESAAANEDLVWRAVLAVIAGGVASAAVAILLGIGVGWSWMQPFTALAEACRRRIDDESVPLPAVSGLHEAEVLRDALERLTAAERGHARRLGDALERERTVNAVHQRFLTQLGHEIGDPLHAMVATLQRLAVEGRLPPEEVAAALDRALELESRLQEALGLVGSESAATSTGPRERGLEGYLAGVAELLQPLAVRQGGSVAVSGSGRISLRPELLTPVLVNLAANALRSRRGVSVTISGSVQGMGSQWRIDDDGPGIEPALAARISDACARGEVLPGSAGIGLGLAVVLANLRALGGRIAMENRPEQGVCFIVDLPPAGSGSALFVGIRSAPPAVVIPP